MLADQGFLNFQGTLRINLLLSVSISGGFSRLLALVSGRVRRGAAGLGTLPGRARSTGRGWGIRRRCGLAVSLSVLGGRQRRREKRDAGDRRNPR